MRALAHNVSEINAEKQIFNAKINLGGSKSRPWKVFQFSFHHNHIIVI